MKALRGRLSYANVISTMALFLVLAGGTAFAAAKLGAGSVGTRQIKKGAVTAAKLKNGAVTPIKLSAASKAALTGPPGAPGAIGPKGDRGPQGETGPRGERGPGATSLEVPVSTSTMTIGTYGGIEVTSACNPAGAAQINLQVPGGTTRLEMFGTSTDGEPGKVFSVNNRSFGVFFFSLGSEHSVSVDIDARKIDTSSPWVRLDLHVDSAICTLGGTVIESQG